MKTNSIGYEVYAVFCITQKFTGMANADLGKIFHRTCLQTLLKHTALEYTHISPVVSMALKNVVPYSLKAE